MPKPNRGFAPAATAFVIWGAFPLYFHLLYQTSALQVIAHRIAWSCVFVVAWMTFRGELASVRAALTNRAVLLRLAGSATLITVNWVAFVYGVSHGRVVETSLGYFIGPLVNVLLGVVLLSEKLTRVQWIAVALAAIGVGYLTVTTGGLPWIALALAISFASYGMVRKVVQVEALPGLATETLLLAPIAAGYLLWCQWAGTGTMGHRGVTIDVLLVFSGPLTAFSLFLFAYGTRLLPYSTVGLLQYITPTLQFMCGVFAFHEPFDRAHAIGFAIIWTALALYIVEGLRIRQPAA
jgi:chloramphenicol-sensitive protein RarD